MKTYFLIPLSAINFTFSYGDFWHPSFISKVWQNILTFSKNRNIIRQDPCRNRFSCCEFCLSVSKLFTTCVSHAFLHFCKKIMAKSLRPASQIREELEEAVTRGAVTGCSSNNIFKVLFTNIFCNWNSFNCRRHIKKYKFSLFLQRNSPRFEFELWSDPIIYFPILDGISNQRS